MTVFGGASIHLDYIRGTQLADTAPIPHPQSYRRGQWLKFWYGDSMWSEDDD